MFPSGLFHGFRAFCGVRGDFGRARAFGLLAEGSAESHGLSLLVEHSRDYEGFGMECACPVGELTVISVSPLPFARRV